mmetsp:Transcript_7658/g.13414  ORF Transcript_7658/g.13414 Transcript_7658/m.13414 type:complete len:502 (-) Transcript_7658:1651-3156(-)
MLGMQVGRRPQVGQNAAPLFLLGSQFEVSDCEVNGSDAGDDEQKAAICPPYAAFMQKFKTLIWMSYRGGFFPMKPPSSFTTDAGWGCMLRSAQMLLAEVLVRHLGKEEWGKCSPASDAHRNLLRWFIDAPKYFAFYSIHRMTETGRQFGKQPGEWYGPNTVALVLRELVHSHSARHQKADKPVAQPRFLEKDYHSIASPTGMTLSVHVTDDSSTFYLSEIAALCEDRDASSQSTESGLASASTRNDDPLLRPTPAPVWKSALFLLVPLRLGLVDISEEYIKPLIAALNFPQCTGMIGGRPAHSLYFVGSQGGDLVYLDPHTVQPAATNEECDDEFFPYQDVVESYHFPVPLMTPITSVDPSLAVGFYCQSAEELNDLVARLGQLHNIGTPFLNVQQDRPLYDDLGTSASESDDEFGASNEPDGAAQTQGVQGGPSKGRKEPSSEVNVEIEETQDTFYDSLDVNTSNNVSPDERTQKLQRAGSGKQGSSRGSSSLSDDFVFL